MQNETTTGNEKKMPIFMSFLEWFNTTVKHSGLFFIIYQNFSTFFFSNIDLYMHTKIILKLKLHYLFIITMSKLPNFEFWRTFSLVMSIVSKQKTNEKVCQNSIFGSLDAVMMNK